MPQMAPLNWIMLYYIFILLFLAVMTLNFYNYYSKFELEGSYDYKIQSEEGMLNKELLKIWKW